MKKTGLLLFIIFTLPFFAAGEETIRRESVFVQSQKFLEENRIPWVPVFLGGKVYDYWIGVGFLLNSPESFVQESPFRSIMQEFPFFHAVLQLRGKAISSSVVFSYGQNDFWGLNARFSF